MPELSDSVGTLQPLRLPGFRRVWIGQGLSSLGSSFTYLAMPLLVLDQSGSPILAGLVGTLQMLAYFAVHLPAGALADRISRRTILLACDAGRAAAIGTIGLALAAGRPLPIPALLGLCVASAVLSSGADPAGQAAVRYLVSGPELPAALALNSLRSQTINLVSPLLGGVLYQVWPALPFLIDAVSFVVSFQLIALVGGLGGGGTARQGLLKDIGAGLRYVARSGYLVLYLIWAALGNLGTAAIGFCLVLAAQPRGGTAVGTALAVVSAGGLAGAALVQRTSARLALTLLVPGITALKALIAVVAMVWPDPVVLTAAMVAIALIGPLISVPLNARVYAEVPDELTGRVQSAMTLIGGALYPFATVLTGWLVQAYSLRVALAGAAALLGAAVLLSLAPRLRTQARAATGDAADHPTILGARPA